MYLKYLLFVFIIIYSAPAFAQQKYSIDTEKGQKRDVYKEKRRDIPREVRRQERIIRKNEKKRQRQASRSERQHHRAVKKHNRLINGSGKDMITNKSVHRRMKKSKREARRINNGKNPVPWYKRVFK